MPRLSFKSAAVLISAAVLLAAVLPAPAAASTHLPGLLSVSQSTPSVTAKGAVYVRSGPGTGFYYLGVLNPGETVPVLGISPDGGWWSVNTRFGEGWVAQVGVTASNTGGVAVRDPGPMGTVTAGALSVRGGPGPNAALLGQLGSGQQVLVIGRSSDGSWLQVRWAYGTGWVAARFLSTTGVPGVVQESVPVTAAPYGIVRAGTLNVRSGPGQNYAVLGKLVLGDRVNIVGRSADNGWFQVQTAFGTGWVSSAYLTTRNEFGAAPVTTDTAAGAPITGPVGIISAGAVNVRTGPGAQYTSLGRLAGGEQGRIIGRSSDWGWYLMETRVGNGWISSRYVLARGDTTGIPLVQPGQTVAPSDGQGGGTAPQPQVTGPTAFIATGALHVRSGPNSAFTSLGTVYAGTRMAIIGQSPDRGWWQVQSPFGAGWVSKAFVRAEGSTGGIPVVQP